jgi:hypothetical protein
MEPQEREKEVTREELKDVIIVVLEGGLVSAVIADPQKEVFIVDYDVDGIEEEMHDMIEVAGSKAAVHGDDVTPVDEAYPGLLDALVKAVNDAKEDE